MIENIFFRLNSQFVNPCEYEIYLQNGVAYYRLKEFDEYYVNGAFKEINCCVCPSGYSRDEINSNCFSAVAPTVSNTNYTIKEGNKNQNNYGLNGVRVLEYNPSSSKYDNITFSRASNGIGTVANPGYWVSANESTASSTDYYSRLNYAGIWAFNPSNVRFGDSSGESKSYTKENGGTVTYSKPVAFTYCLTLDEAKTVYIGSAADNFIEVKINGDIIPLKTELTTANNAGASFEAFRWYNLIKIDLTEGLNFIEVAGVNASSSAAFVFEIFDAALADILNAKFVINSSTNKPFVDGPTNQFVADNGLHENILFSTRNLFNTPFVYYECPNGYAKDTCSSGPVMCKSIRPCNTEYGCTDINSTNYNPDANVDDGSCIDCECNPNSPDYPTQQACEDANPTCRCLGYKSSFEQQSYNWTCRPIILGCPGDPGSNAVEYYDADYNTIVTADCPDSDCICSDQITIYDTLENCQNANPNCECEPITGSGGEFPNTDFICGDVSNYDFEARAIGDQSFFVPNVNPNAFYHIDFPNEIDDPRQIYDSVSSVARFDKNVSFMIVEGKIDITVTSNNSLGSYLITGHLLSRNTSTNQISYFYTNNLTQISPTRYVLNFLTQENFPHDREIYLALSMNPADGLNITVNNTSYFKMFRNP